MHHIAVLHHVIFAFLAQLAGFAAALLAAVGHVVGEAGRLGLDEAALEIGMDDASSLRGLRADGNGPRAALGLAAGEERLDRKSVV